MINKLKTALNSGQRCVNGWLSMTSNFAAEILSHQPYNSITIDIQHGLIDYQNMVRMLQSINNTGNCPTPLVRVPWCDPAIIMKTLDAGAEGIICPMINNQNEAKKLVSYCNYPPHGIRSFGPTRAGLIHGKEYAVNANKNIICIAMIETKQGFDNCQEIIETSGIDAIYIGPGDLTMTLSNGSLPPGLDRREKNIIDSICQLIQCAHKANKKIGIHTLSHTYAAECLEWGCDFVTLSGDTRLLSEAAENSLKKFSNSSPYWNFNKQK